MNSRMAKHLASRIASNEGKGKRVKFTMQHQDKGNWCWAATSASAAAYFDAESAWTQCLVASALLKTECCGGDVDDEICDQPAKLDEALDIVSCLHRAGRGVEGPETLKREIAAKKPLCIRVEWKDQRGHFLAVVGWYLDGKGAMVYLVDDPLYGFQHVPGEKIATRYRNTGRWTHSCFLKAPTVAQVANDASLSDDEAWEADDVDKRSKRPPRPRRGIPGRAREHAAWRPR